MSVSYQTEIYGTLGPACADEEILTQINNLLAHMFDVLNSELEEQKTIANQIGQMA